MNKVSTDLGRRPTLWLPWALAVIAAMGLGLVRTVAQVIAQRESDGVVPTHERSSAQQSATAGQTPGQRYFTDVVLLNQNGEPMRFYSDLLQGKVVIINSFFGTCRDSCLPMNRNLERVQQALGDRVGKDVRIISISVDPTVDTVASLKEYAKTLHAGPGWYFLTGDKQNVDAILRKLGQFVEDKQNHLNLIIVGNEPTGLWKKAFGLARSEELVRVVESVLNDQ
jgi:protein SCO1/2